VINKLIDPNSSAFRRKLFTGSYYKPPYTDEFKKYFGLEFYNAGFVFCDNNGVPPGAGTVLPREAYGNEYYVIDKAYKAANVYAQEINSCVYESKYGR
jgi:hypothetical protein